LKLRLGIYEIRERSFMEAYDANEVYKTGVGVVVPPRFLRSVVILLGCAGVQEVGL